MVLLYPFRSLILALELSTDCDLEDTRVALL